MWCAPFYFSIFIPFERAEGSTRAVIALSDLYVYPLFYFRRLPETWLHNRKVLAFYILFFYVRCSSIQLNRGTFNRPVATPFFLSLLISFSRGSVFSSICRRRLVGRPSSVLGDYTYDAKRHARLARSNPLLLYLIQTVLVEDYFSLAIN